MNSDILVFFKSPLSEPVLAKAKKALMDVDRSVLVHKPDGPGKVLLVKFDSTKVTPARLLGSLEAAGMEASIAGG